MRFEDYVKELNKVELLEPNEENALWYALKEGDEAARRKIIQAYQPLVFKQAVPYRTHEGIMDIVQEGTVGLIEAVETYDVERGVAFSLFAVHRIRGRIINFLRKEATNGKLTSIDADFEEGRSTLELIAAPGETVAELAEANELKVRVREALSALPQKEKLVIEQVYLTGGKIKDVAEQMNVSASYIYRLQKTGIRRIRGMLSRFMHGWQK